MNLHAIFRVRTGALGLSLTTMAAGCTDQTPMDPEPTRAIVLALSASEVTGLAAIIDDARERVLPSLVSGDEVGGLGAAFGELSAALGRENRPGLVAALERARTELAALARRDSAGDTQAELAGLLLALRSIETIALGSAGSESSIIPNR